MLRAVFLVFVSCALRCAVSLEEDSIKDIVRGLVDEQLGQLKEDYLDLREENVKRDEQLGQLKKENVELRSQMADLKRDTTVFFSATVNSADYTVTSGSRVIFPSVLANGGNSFNAATSEFTCPQTGHYLFSMNYASRNGDRTPWDMYRDNDIVAQSIIEIRDGAHYTASNTVIILCNAGNKVYINCGAGSNCRMRGAVTASNFSGFFVGA